MYSTPWHLDGRTATLTLPRLSLAFDANQPGEGLQNIRVLGRFRPFGRLFGVTGPIQTAANCELTDWYVRGDDLIATYETGQPDAARVDLHWQVVQPEKNDAQIATIKLFVSIRTDRLDWRHDVCLKSIVPTADELWEGQPGHNSFAGNDWNCLLELMVHSSDLRHQELTRAPLIPNAWLLKHELFPTKMLEKGVILRARAAAAFFNLDGQVRGYTTDRLAVSNTQMQGFLAADPPLGI